MGTIKVGSQWVRSGGANFAERRINQALHVVVPSAIHDDYCGSYPLTYEFSVPVDGAGCKGQWRPSRGDSWQDLPAPGAEREDGVELARFDYQNGLAYLSVPFAATSDELYLRVVDAVGNPTGNPTGNVCEFYDNRRSAVVVTYDDWFGDTHAPFLNAAAAHQANRLWMSPGINGEYPSTPPNYPLGPLTELQWGEMADVVAAGWVEPHNHGLTHQNASTYADQADAENDIVGGRQAILDHVTMPPQSRRGATQYAHGFVEPNGASTALARQVLGENKFLSDRRVASGMTTWTTWDATNGLYNRSGYGVLVQAAGSVTADTVARDAIIAHFDARHAAGGEIILIYSYPYLWNDTTFAQGTPGADWIEHVGSHDDIWSVGWGHIYQYRRLWETVTATAVRQ